MHLGAIMTRRVWPNSSYAVAAPRVRLGIAGITPTPVPLKEVGRRLQHSVPCKVVRTACAHGPDTVVVGVLQAGFSPVPSEGSRSLPQLRVTVGDAALFSPAMER